MKILLGFHINKFLDERETIIKAMSAYFARLKQHILFEVIHIAFSLSASYTITQQIKLKWVNELYS